MVIILKRCCRDCRRERLCPDEIALRGVGTCRECAGRNRIETRRTWARRNRDRDRETNRRWRARNTEKAREASRRWKREHVEEVNEANRMAHRLRREREGRPSQPLTAEDYERRYGTAQGDGRHSNIDGAPLVKEIRKWLDDRRVERVSRDEHLDMHTIHGLGRHSGVTVRTLTRWLAAENPRCSLVAADRVAIAIGSHLDILYADAPGVDRGR